MTRLPSLMFLVLALQLGASAHTGIDFSNSGGTLTGSDSGLSLNGSTLILVDDGRLVIGSDLGTVTFTTGFLTSGTLQMGGTFAGPVTWSLITLANGTTTS